MKYDIILFDADGTLYDFDASEREALTETLVWAGLPTDEGTMMLYHEINARQWQALERGETTRERLRTERFEIFIAEMEKNGYVSDKTAVMMADSYIEKLSHQCILIPEAVEVCRKLSEKCTLYIVTNGTAWVQKSRFASSPLNEYITKTYISEEIGCAKPAREFFDAVLADIGISYEQAQKRAVVIGDSISSDIMGGINSGLDTCWYNPKSKSSGDVNPTYTVTSLYELYPIIFSE